MIYLIRTVLREDFILKFDKILPYLDNFVFKLISFGAKRKFIKHYNQYIKFGKIPKNVEEIIILANYKTRGKIRQSIISTSSKSQIPNNSNLFSSETIDRVVSELRHFGFSVVGNLRDDKIKFELDNLKNLPVFSRKNKNARFLINPKNVSNPDSSLDHMYSVLPEQVFENTGIQNLILDGFWKQISDSYLGAPTRISSLRCWYSFPTSDKANLTPENWHLDAGDGMNFIKFFLLLSDVQLESGPTSVIPIPSHILPRKFYTGRRYSDLEINEVLNKKNLNEIKAIGKAGTIYVIDTRLLHRGTPVESGFRFLVNWMASADKFGSISREDFKLKPENPLAHRSDLI